MDPHDQAPVPTPWLTAKEAGLYLHRSPRFIVRAIKLGKIRGAVVSRRGRGEILTKACWLDEYVERHETPQLLPYTPKRRQTG